MQLRIDINIQDLHSGSSFRIGENVEVPDVGIMELASMLTGFHDVIAGIKGIKDKVTNDGCSHTRPE